MKEAERELRHRLQRVPYEAERRDDPAWAMAALKFKTAENQLFVAKALRSWDDDSHY